MKLRFVNRRILMLKHCLMFGRASWLGLVYKRTSMAWEEFICYIGFRFHDSSSLGLCSRSIDPSIVQASKQTNTQMANSFPSLLTKTRRQVTFYCIPFYNSLFATRTHSLGNRYLLGMLLNVILNWFPKQSIHTNRHSYQALDSDSGKEK